VPALRLDLGPKQLALHGLNARISLMKVYDTTRGEVAMLYDVQVAALLWAPLLVSSAFAG
jgi:hypothetical protein